MTMRTLYSISGYRLVDMEAFSGGVVKTLYCPECHYQRLELKEEFTKEQGLASCLMVSCACGYLQPFRTSQNCGKNGFGLSSHIMQ